MEGGFAFPKNLGSIPGTPIQFNNELTANPGAAVKLIDETIPDGHKFYVATFFGSCLASGKFEIFHIPFSTGTPEMIGSGRTVSGGSNVPFFWNPARQLEEKDKIQVYYEAIADSPSGLEVSAHLMAGDQQV